EQHLGEAAIRFGVGVPKPGSRPCRNHSRGAGATPPLGACVRKVRNAARGSVPGGLRRVYARGTSALAAALDAGVAFFGAHDLELDAAVLLPRNRVRGLVERTVLAVTLRDEAVRADAPSPERLHHARRARPREAEVVLVARAFVGVATGLDDREFRVALQRGRHRVEDCVRLRQDLGAARLELHLLEDQDVAALDDDLALVGAAVLVLEAVVRLGLV